MKLSKMALSVLLGACCLTGSQAMAQGMSAGVRLWQADWKVGTSGGDFSLGDAPFFIGYLGYHDAAFNLIGQVGSGSGWDYNGERLDLALAVTQSRDAVSYGVGVRSLDLSASEDGEGFDLTRVGPEFLLGMQGPIGESGFGAGISGSLAMFWYDYEDSSFVADGSTLGYSLDGNLYYALDAANLRVGYRLQSVEDDASIAGDEFDGFYVDLGFNW